MSNRDLAYNIAQRGWFVFPCKPDKTPYTAHGFRDANTNLSQIISWWAEYPDALVGLACAMSGIFAVDIDDLPSWNEFERKHSEGYWKTGPVQKTPRGGMHLLFRLPVDMNIPNNAGKLAVGVDLRSNGYICTGTGYTWIGEGGINRPLVDAPAWLLKQIDKLNPHEDQAAQLPPVIKVEGLAGFFLEKSVQAARIGNRNNTGFDLACQLRDNGLSEVEARPYMIEYSMRVPQELNHQYKQAEAMASLKVAYSRPARSPIVPGYTRGTHG